VAAGALERQPPRYAYTMTWRAAMAPRRRAPSPGAAQVSGSTMTFYVASRARRRHRDVVLGMCLCAPCPCATGPVPCHSPGCCRSTRTRRRRLGHGTWGLHLPASLQSPYASGGHCSLPRAQERTRALRRKKWGEKLTCGPTFVLEARGPTLARVKMTLHTISLAFETKNEYFITFNVHW
jgi:hypothetical protein